MNREVELVLSGLHASGQEQEKQKRWRPCSRHNILRETTVIICSMRRKWMKTKLPAGAGSNSGSSVGTDQTGDG